METSDGIAILGVFEDSAQHDFMLGLLDAAASRLGVRIKVAGFLTQGCRPENLISKLRTVRAFHGVVVGVDAGQLTTADKRAHLLDMASEYGVSPEDSSVPALWAVAHPSVEEWMMADEQAFPAALRSSFSPHSLRRAARPGKSESERTAKKRLDEWATGLLGEALLDRGSAYAYQTGTETRPDNVGEGRNPDLHVLLRDELPNFLEACAVRQSAS